MPRVRAPGRPEVTGRKGAGRKVARPYGLWLKVKGPNGPIRTERWYENRSDRDRAFAALPGEFGTRLLGSGKLSH